MTDVYSEKFTWKVLNELPVDKIAISFPRETKDTSKFYVVQVSIGKSHEWIGNFKGVDRKYLSGVFLWPDHRRLCIIAGGSAYVVLADNPDSYIELPITPVVDVRDIPDQGIILLITFWEISAFGELGLLWRTENLALDGILIREIRNGIIYGVSKKYDGAVEFKIDLKTGQ